jgi:hypothetical protein
MRIAKCYKCALLNEQVVLYKVKMVLEKRFKFKSLQNGELLNLKFAYDHDYISSTKYRVAVFFSDKIFRKVFF